MIIAKKLKRLLCPAAEGGLPRLLRLPGMCVVGLLCSVVNAAPQIDLEGLMPKTAILLVDGERKMLREGQSFKGVTLIAAYSRTATLEVQGKQVVLGLSQRVGSNYQAPPAQVVSISRNASLQYLTNASINGRKVEVLVDTGANMVAMNESEALRMGINLKQAAPAQVETASGVVPAWSVSLASVDVGGIRVNNVPATVIAGAYPGTVLLGMTYLRHVKIEENKGILTLSRMQ
ncbi:retropepsin-like aspartic protease family protein [Pseudohalioglobus lutimaris]|uniref:TIGR02281 family clan AA aspartic protease n=1 Tax=Pseudohalioglobus lutimaris TaxID=1737061 RepID=A0A2N5X2D9_9GAMM|nr:TIGR02281 family clan AA aspartic protease [Pseudohalioglobus lutimaris]PLW68657.1 TIGR02281 family clan AA aspartic protease [Pseudohalioglobus lutimaris]